MTGEQVHAIWAKATWNYGKAMATRRWLELSGAQRAAWEFIAHRLPDTAVANFPQWYLDNAIDIIAELAESLDAAVSALTPECEKVRALEAQIAAYQASQSEGEGEVLGPNYATPLDDPGFLRERTPGEKAAYLQGYEAGKRAAPVPPAQPDGIDYKALVDDIKRRYPKILAALAEDEPPASKWRGIESAPRDGTRFLAATYRTTALPGHEAKELTPPWRYVVTWWDAEFEQVGWDDHQDEPRYRGAWTAGAVGNWGMEELAEEHPTHWQPLPSPPDTAQGEG